MTAVDTVILGAGMSGLGAALSLQAPAYEARLRPGGLCHSYYLDDAGMMRDPSIEDVSDCFRFELAGGHWLFGLNGAARRRLGRFERFRRYVRRSAVYFPSDGRIVPFPLQDNLYYLDVPLRARILEEILANPSDEGPPCVSFKDWLLAQFGPTLCELFFFPFNERYTAGAYAQIAPQDAYKSAIDRDRVLRGAKARLPQGGYNVSFYYPLQGLDHLTRAIASQCTVHYDRAVTHVDTEARALCFANGRQLSYRRLVSTIALDRMLVLCGLQQEQGADPATAVLVVNVAARAGARCPPYHWLYVPHAESGMHRVGFYSHVEPSFLPARHRGDPLVSLYAERSYPAGALPDAVERSRAAAAMVAELQAWEFIGEPIVMHAGFADPAYTWSRPGSDWVQQGLQTLAKRGISQIGRYGAWRFQGMAASFEEGWSVGEALRRKVIASKPEVL